MAERQAKNMTVAFLVVATVVSILVFLIFPSLISYCFLGIQPSAAVVIGIGFWAAVVAAFFIGSRIRK